MLTTFILDPVSELTPAIEGTSEISNRGHRLVPGPENSLIFCGELLVDPVLPSMASACCPKIRPRFSSALRSAAATLSNHRLFPFRCRTSCIKPAWALDIITIYELSTESVRKAHLSTNVDGMKPVPQFPPGY